LLARIARVALSFKCKAPTGEALWPRSSSTPAHKPHGARPLRQTRAIPSAGEPAHQSSRFAARPDRDRAAFASPSRSTGGERRALELASARTGRNRRWRRSNLHSGTESSHPREPCGGGSPPFGGYHDKVKSANAQSTVATQSMGDVMRLTFKLHDTSPPFVELCLETWRQDVHGSAPIISPHLTTANEIRQSCANFRAQINRVEREAIAALVAKKKTP
jgi:hypothetical protein